MEDYAKSFETVLERATEYGKTSIELAKLKVLEKTSNVSSKLVVHYIVICFIASFMLFSSLGLAFWLGEILGKIWYGFYVLAAFYGFTGIVLHFFMRKKLKKSVKDYIIKEALK